MNKLEFLAELDGFLKKLQKAEREKFITYYDEMIADYVETGMSEAEAVKKVGNPQEIAAELLAEADTITLPLPKSNNKILFVVLLVLGFPLWGSLALAAILTILSVYLALLCIPFAAGTATVAFLIGSLVSIIGFPFVMAGSFSVGLAQLGMGVVSLGLSFLFAWLTVPATKYIAMQIKKVTLFLLQYVKRSVKL